VFKRLVKPPVLCGLRMAIPGRPTGPVRDGHPRAVLTSSKRNINCILLISFHTQITHFRPRISVPSPPSLPLAVLFCSPCPDWHRIHHIGFSTFHWRISCCHLLSAISFVPRQRQTSTSFPGFYCGLKSNHFPEKIRLLKMQIDRELRVCSCPVGGHSRGSQQAGQWAGAYRA
jgi:hypothetical protein